MVDNTYRIGGDFLIRPIGTDKIFIREYFDDDELAPEVIKAVNDFAYKTVGKSGEDEANSPNMANLKQACEKALESGKFTTVVDAVHQPNLEKIREILKDMGELGLLGLVVPAKYAPEVTMYEDDEIPKETIKDIAAETFARMPHTNVIIIAVMCHTGIGMHPILWFGTEEQKLKYLPTMASGETPAAYALTEPGSGSDALAAKANAKYSEDGKELIINGQKMFITNAGFADYFTVFMQIPDSQGNKKFSAVIIPRDTEGLTMGKDEEKMGLHTSSTRALFLDNVRVPVENIIGGPEKGIGLGTKIALTVLTKGRKTLSTACLGQCKRAIDLSIQYMKSRKQFGTTLDKFDALKEKIAESVMYTYLLDSSIYRLDYLIDEESKDIPLDAENYYELITDIQKKFTIEGSLLKVLGSEILEKIADHAVQSHGGYGYIKEYEVCNIYVGSRINKIWEGTNEINRNLACDFLIKSDALEKLPLRKYRQSIENILNGNEKPGFEINPLLEKEALALEYAKILFHYTYERVISRFGPTLKSQHQILKRIADMMGLIYLLESGLLRTSQCIETNDSQIQLRCEIMKYACSELLENLSSISKELLLTKTEEESNLQINTLEEEMLDTYKKLSEKLTLNFDKVHLRKNIADATINKDEYFL